MSEPCPVSRSLEVVSMKCSRTWEIVITYFAKPSSISEKPCGIPDLAAAAAGVRTRDWIA